MDQKSIATSRLGDKILGFVKPSHAEAGSLMGSIGYSTVIMKCQGKFLLIFNRGRDQWEFPGGKVEAGEDPQACAIRELMEESGQTAENFKLEAIVKTYFKNAGKIAYGALYSAESSRLLPFQGNAEVSRIKLWDPCSNEDSVDEFGQALFNAVSKDFRLSQMKYQCVIFDLFGTLVPNFSAREYRQTVLQMASVLSVPLEEFWQLWRDTFNERVLGIIPDLEANVIYVCQKLGLKPDESQIKEAVRIRFDYEIQTMGPRPEAVEVLSALKSRGLKIGLISDCSFEAPAIWKDTPLAPFFDVTVFSCLEKMRKPDPRIYRLALDRLGLKPEACLYVGDGSSRELNGASQVGLHAVQLRIPAEDNPDNYQVDKESWPETIKSLTDVLKLLNSPEP